ncbi:MAG: hypothetical protein DRJ33_06085, partial [Candidatus Methanomethylicota archaeon]
MDVLTEYAAKRRFWYISIAILSFTLFFASIISLCIGPTPISFNIALKSVLKQVPLLNSMLSAQGFFSDLPSQEVVIVVSIRLPRILTCMFAGAALGLAGAI